jgi:drug/metabolite transporter (DMT)-like permease
MLRAYLLLVMCATIWGSNAVFGYILVKKFPPMLFGVTRLLIASVFYLLYLVLTKRTIRLKLQELLRFLPLALIGTVLNNLSFYKGLQTVDPTTSALILALTPITTGALAVWFLKEKITQKMLIGSILAVTGVFFVIGRIHGMHLTIGIAWTFLAMFTSAASLIMIRRMTKRYDSQVTTAYNAFLSTILFAPIALAGESTSDMSTQPWDWVMLIASAIVIQGLANLIWNHQMHIVGVGRAAVFINLEPFAAMGTGLLLLGIRVTWIQIIGSIMIIGGVFIATTNYHLKIWRRLHV